jgi:hypothetical protein
MSTRHKLYDHEVNPPSGVWDRIAASLDDEAMGRKLYDTEVTPPAGNWNKIAAALDEAEAQRPVYADKLYNAEVQPPAHVWQQIATSLNEEESPRVIPMQQRRAGIYRYLAAAVLAGVAILAAWNWLGSSEEESTIASTDTISRKPMIEQVPASGNITNTTQAGEQQLLAADSDVPLKRNRVQSSDRTTGNTGYSSAVYASNSTVNVKHPADRYIMLITPDGNIIRMSKKWGDMVCCVSGEEQDDACKDQLQRWQEKMAEAPVAPSPDNFMDILTLVNTLNETDL